MSYETGRKNPFVLRRLSLSHLEKQPKLWQKVFSFVLLSFTLWKKEATAEIVTSEVSRGGEEEKDFPSPFLGLSGMRLDDCAGAGKAASTRPSPTQVLFDTFPL